MYRPKYVHNNQNKFSYKQPFYITIAENLNISAHIWENMPYYTRTTYLDCRWISHTFLRFLAHNGEYPLWETTFGEKLPAGGYRRFLAQNGETPLEFN